ncbi:MAG: NUDIX hydrolase [Bacteroidales bacterium]|nr:NUDIX hydrolase [Bacteroidales bacterium]
METFFNPYISVDIVVFGFDDNEGLKVLLINRSRRDDPSLKRLKLPGNFINKKEKLHDSANRILKEFTGIKNIYLKQFAVFDDPGRLGDGDDLKWLRDRTGTEIERVVTIAYYSLVKLHQYSETELSKAYNARWFGMDEVPGLIFDHNQIIDEGLATLQKEFLTEPLCFELLPKKFTINQLQRISEAILGFSIDNRNFRKRINRLEYVVALNERQTGVSHKPARYYIFDREKFDILKREHTGFII